MPRRLNVAKTRRKRHHYTDSQRAHVLAAAAKEGLTATDVQKRFGVTPVTYYSWRKKGGVTARRGRAISAGTTTLDLTSHVRREVQAKVRSILPELVRGEVNQYLDQVFGTRRGGRRKV
jgi:transposase-like protein